MGLLVGAAVVLGLAFAWWFPAPDLNQVGPTTRFTDVTAAAGLTFTHRHGSGHSPTTLGGGVAAFDYDQDGWTDLLFVNGSPWPWSNNAWQSPGTSALYHNNGDGSFTDVTAAAGLDFLANGMSPAIGDYDADGWPDIFITAIGENRLFRNHGDGTFHETTNVAGVAGENNTWSTAAVWLDFDHDGQLDLIVAHYARWPGELGLAAAFSVAQVGRSYGAPVGFVGVDPTVYRNLGDGRFGVVRDPIGLRHLDVNTGRPTAKTLALRTLDANNDGHLDLHFTYHTAPDAWFLAEPDGTFTPWNPTSEPRREGLAATITAPGALPLASLSDDTFLQLAPAPEIILPPSLDLTAKLGGRLLDTDNDGYTEFFAAGGLAEHDTNIFPDDYEPGRFAHAPQLWWREQSSWTPAAQMPSLTARGMATLDFDGDGDLDIAIAQNAGPAKLLRNDQRMSLPWLALKLIATRSHPDASGARIELHTPRRIFVRTVAPATSYMAQSESTVRFGLGTDSRIRRIVIRWPSGQRQELKSAELNTTLTVREP